MFLHRLLLAVCLVAYAPLSLCAHVFFEINLTWEIRAPDGQPRYVILSNGQLPGPQLTLDYGDDVEVSQSLPQLPFRADFFSLSFTTTFPLIRPSISMVLSMWSKLQQPEKSRTVC